MLKIFNDLTYVENFRVIKLETLQNSHEYFITDGRSYT